MNITIRNNSNKDGRKSLLTINIHKVKVKN